MLKQEWEPSPLQQRLPSHVAQVHWLAVVLLATGCVIILYSKTVFFHKNRFMCGVIYFLQFKHCSTWVDTVTVIAVECGVLKTHMHCKKILCICQSQFCVCSVLKMKWGPLFLEETVRAGHFQHLLSLHIVYDILGVWKYNKINGLQYWVVFCMVHPAYVF